jgi:hypothetical protein
MKACGRCGAQNSDEQGRCTVCGLALSTPVGSGTLVLHAPPAQPHVPPPGTPAPAAPSPDGAASPLPAAGAKFKGTMIGLAPAEVAPHAVTSAAAAAARAGLPAAAEAPAPAQLPSAQKTILGVARPGIAPVPVAPSAQKTILGVARPGIAPLNPGMAKPSSPPPAAAPARASPQPARPAASSENVRRTTPLPLLPALLIVGALMSIGTAIAVFFSLRAGVSIAAKAGVDAAGRDVLELTCAECPDATKVWAGAAQATFQNQSAKLTLGQPLRVGENALELGVERPQKRREQIALNVPVEYRVRGSTELLSQAEPKVSLVASGVPGTTLVVDGQTSSLASSPLRIDYDVGRELEGPQASVTLLERRIPYAVTPPGGSGQPGEALIRIGITPLVIDAPGASITLSDSALTIAGRTAPGAAVRIGDAAVPADESGRFRQRIDLPSGESQHVVRAALRDHAPRFVRIKVRRASDLAREAALASAMAELDYAGLQRAQERAVGRRAALSGRVFDLRSDGLITIILLDSKDGCTGAACLVKLVYGAPLRLEQGKVVRAFGQVTRFVDGPKRGQRIPEVAAELVVHGGA